jgi:hypothetical protein
MSNISQMTPYTKVKQSTDHDSRNFGPLVSGYEAQVSTLSQTVINLSQFVCDLSRKSNIMVFIDGQLLTEGVGNDYTWSAGINNTSNQLTLAAAIPAGLNIQIYKIGATQSPIANADTIQAGVNLISNQVDQKNSNKIINGAFDFWQRGTSFAAVAATNYVADRFQYQKSGAMVHTIARSTDVPSTSNSTYSMLIDCTTLDASIAAAEQSHILQRIEGNVLRSFKGKSMVLAFYVKATKIGTYCISLRNNGLDRSIVKEYAVTASDTWERKVIRFQHDPTGTWLYDTGTGVSLSWVLASGTNFQTTADTWQAGNFLSTSNQVNACDSTSNNFYLSDIVLVEDNDTLTKIPDFCFAGRDYVEELQLCQRYYEKSMDVSNAPGGGGNPLQGCATFTPTNDAGGSAEGYNPFKVEKRVIPAVISYNESNTTANGASQRGVPDVTTGALSRHNTKGLNRIIASPGASASAEAVVTCHWTADAEL